MLERCEPEPPEAVEIFEDTIGLARVFAKNLAIKGEERGLIGPLELPRLWTRHIINSALLASLLKPGQRVGDIGTGAGLPGLVLAIARPDVSFVLIEPMERRVVWLTEQISELELKNVDVRRARAEEVKLPELLDCVTARAVSGLKKLLPLTVPLLRDQGELLLMKGVGIYSEIESARKELKKYNVTDIKVLFLGEGVVLEPTRVFRGIIHRNPQK